MAEADIHNIARFIASIWQAAALLSAVLSIFNIPLILFYAGHRLVELRREDMTGNPALPVHMGLHYFAAMHFGLLLPAFYFLTVRRTNQLSEWQLGSGTNTTWTIAIGAACMTWLLWRILASQTAPERWKIIFRRQWVDIVFLFACVGLCLWFHLRTLSPLMNGMDMGNMGVLAGIVYPQSCFAGASVFFILGLIEVLTRKRPPRLERRPGRALAASLLLMTVLFSPFLLSIPRVTHTQAMSLLRQNKQVIITAAEDAALDPALLAGIVYVAHTRDHPRWTGRVIEEMAYGEGNDILTLNSSIGLFQIRRSTTNQLSMMVNSGPNLPGYQVGPTELTGRYRCFRKVQIWNPNRLVAQTGGAYAGAMLRLFCEQWAAAGYPIEDRPEILATLYNIGFERSHPKPNPRANDFGRRVKEFMESEECRALFAPPGESVP